MTWLKAEKAMRRLLWALVVIITTSLVSPAARAQGASGVPNLIGTWTGSAEFLLPAGKATQYQSFVFTLQDGRLLAGEHHWRNEGDAPISHVGKEATDEAIEPFLGVIGEDGVISLVEIGDHTYFRLILRDADTIHFTAVEGGDFPIAGHGVLIREQ